MLWFNQGEIVHVLSFGLWQTATYVRENENGTHKVRIGRSVTDLHSRNVYRRKKPKDQ